MDPRKLTPALHALAAELDARAAIVEHGLFLGRATEAILAGRMPGPVRLQGNISGSQFVFKE